MANSQKFMELVSSDGPGGRSLAVVEAQHLHVLLKKAERARQRGDIHLAEYFTRRAVAVSSYNETKANLYLRLGQLAEQQREYANAVECYGRGIALEPRDARVIYYLNNNMGYSLCMVDRHEAAEPYCRAAIEVDRKRYNAHKNLGLSLRGQLRIAEAARSLASAAILWPHDRRALGHLEDLLENQEGGSSLDSHTIVLIEEARRIAPERSDVQASAGGPRRVTRDPSGKADDGTTLRRGRPPVIVIVDDEESVRSVLSAEFRVEGFVAFGYGDKRQFLDELHSFPVDLILTDLNCPGMRGMELLKALKADRRWKNIPVIIVSGGLTLKNAIEARALGAADCIAKPYDYCDLLARMQEVLGISRDPEQVDT